MGKSKNQKNKNVFKVASGRSTKAKNKLKSMDVEYLKNISARNKEKIESIDQQLYALNEEIRQVPQSKKDTIKNAQVNVPSKTEKIEKFKELEEICNQALETLNSFEM